jgi:hypothetical protein
LRGGFPSNVAARRFGETVQRRQHWHSEASFTGHAGVALGIEGSDGDVFEAGLFEAGSGLGQSARLIDASLRLVSHNLPYRSA